ncbi:MAG: molybdenum cofactor guanylyltransferase [Candidatus Omnitrophica bacterium]|nr:molybdenum cofactor guanylyltransferase [Candidatus Omnitrophota bacterium]MBI3083893.1 molybdenum cofactor guanylyltransferase [Candidatus Omnitrophota bacterium]
MRDGVSGIVLAGGHSRRMGCEKANLPWGRTTLIRHVTGALRPIVDELLIVVKDARAFRHLNARVVEDLVPDAHALGGLYTGLRAAAHDLCFTCACDAPFLNPRLIRFLIALAEGWDAVIPQTREGLLQPLHAVYARSALPAIEEHLRQRRWDLRALAQTARVKIVGPELIARYDPAGLSCVNLNTPSEYETACAIDSSWNSSMTDAHHRTLRRLRVGCME